MVDKTPYHISHSKTGGFHVIPSHARLRIVRLCGRQRIRRRCREEGPGQVRPRPCRILFLERIRPKYFAEQIQNVSGGKLVEIKPKNAYPKDCNACLAQAQKEIRGGIHPELANEPVDFKQYDVIDKVENKKVYLTCFFVFCGYSKDI